jgi:hypothetical protein
MHDTVTVQQMDNDTILKVNLKYLHLANEAVNISEEEITKEDILATTKSR